MSDIFFKASHAVQTAQIMMRFEEVVVEKRPDLLLVYGDVKATDLVCAKWLIPVGHVDSSFRASQALYRGMSRGTRETRLAQPIPSCQREFGFRATVNFEEGLEGTIKWYLAQRQ
jgi:UDP-N-acetylglucosamine 2-epimerase